MLSIGFYSLGDAMSEQNPAYKLMSLYYGFMISEALHAVALLNIADHLVEGPKDVKSLAVAVSANDDALDRVLRLLTQVGVFAVEQEKYRLNEVSQLLRSDVPGSLKPHLQYKEIPRLNAYRELFYSVKTGKPAFDHIYGTDYFDYISKDQKLAKAFDDFMSATTKAEVTYITKEFNFGKYRKIADIGGGQGILLRQILKDYAQVEGLLVDLPEAIKKAEQLFEPDLKARCQFSDRSFFEVIPANQDLYILKQVLHDWDDHKCNIILKNLARAMSNHNHFVIIEPLKTKEQQSLLENEVDLCLLTFLGGRRRSEQDFAELLATAGLQIDQITTSRNLPVSYIQGSKIK